ncbi:protein S100-A12-like [Notechis scutatus]|uniref:Protein S100-A12-like n=1 Tax=Notechis scutatus TaxID=8663 RepID=A0A6J1W2Q0_9SAUR|nr:protein S100-A12-like [Notechis scutatus]XP_026549430.1 protein S100-A12-like [Notechis scutatus]
MPQTQMEKCCECIIDVFHKYSMQKKPYDMLSKAELAQLLREQLPNFIQGSRDPAATDRLFKELDQNKDEKVSFDEFMRLVGTVFTVSYRDL